MWDDKGSRGLRLTLRPQLKQQPQQATLKVVVASHCKSLHPKIRKVRCKLKTLKKKTFAEVF